MESDEQKGAPEKASRRITDVGGTRGGFGEFVLGLLLLALGAYLLMARVVVTSGARSFFGDHSIGVALIPLFAGIALLFANARSIVGWVLTGLGGVAILAAILADLQIYFRPTSLFNTVAMLGVSAAGLGLVLRALRAHE